MSSDRLIQSDNNNSTNTITDWNKQSQMDD